MFDLSRNLKSILAANVYGLLILLVSTNTYATVVDNNLRTYEVTISNLTSGQVLSPPVAATHGKSVRMFQVGRLATPELAGIAQDGQEGIPAMLKRLSASKAVTDVVVAPPIMTAGNTFAGFTDTTTFNITARPDDRFSFSTMLICTNDGFTGLDSAKLPEKGTKTIWVGAYDSGTENNTELSRDIVDSCSAVGPVPLDGDPNGNEDAAVATYPAAPIFYHPGVLGVGDLTPAKHNWIGSVARITIKRIR